LVQYISVNQSHLWLADAATGAMTRLTPEGRDSVAWSGGQFATDGRGVYTTTDQGSEFRRVAYIEQASRRVTPLTSDIPWDVDDFDLSPDGKTIAFTANEAGLSKLYLFDTATRRHRAAANVPAGQVFGLVWHLRGRHLGFTVNSSRSTSDAYSLDEQTGEITRWTESELGGSSLQSFRADANPLAQLRQPGNHRLFYRPPPVSAVAVR
jgi:Tol biopolymer transport system component